MYSRRQSYWASLPPYLGGKRKLCPVIFREIDRVLPRGHWQSLHFFDAFAGGCAVALAAKARGFDVTACDIATRSLTVAQALVANCHVMLGVHDILRVVASAKFADGKVSQKYVPSVFPPNLGRLLDAILIDAERSEIPAKAALERLLALRVAMLAHPMSSVRPGTARRAVEGNWEAITPSCVKHFVDAHYLDSPERLWTLAQKINRGVFTGRGRAIQGDTLEVLPEIDAHIIYADPPYPGTQSYESEYRVVDDLLGDERRPSSLFSAQGGASLLDKLFERAQHIPIWILSYGNAVTTLDELEKKMAQHGRVTRVKSIRYAHKSAQASDVKKWENREFILIGVDPRTTLPIRRGDALHEVAL